MFTVRVTRLGTAAGKNSLLPGLAEALFTHEEPYQAGMAVAELLAGVPVSNNSNYYSLSTTEWPNEIVETVRLSIVCAGAEHQAAVFSAISGPFTSPDLGIHYRSQGNHKVPILVLIGLFEAAIECYKTNESAHQSGYNEVFTTFLSKLMRTQVLTQSGSGGYERVSESAQELFYSHNSVYGSIAYRKKLQELITDFYRQRGTSKTDVRALIQVLVDAVTYFAACKNKVQSDHFVYKWGYIAEMLLRSGVLLASQGDIAPLANLLQTYQASLT